MVRISLTVDADDAVQKLGNAPERLQRAIMRALPQIGRAGETIMSKYLVTRLKAPQGALRGSIRSELDGASVVVGPHAESATGFPYPNVVDQGRGEILPKKGKYLSWVAGGRRVFAKRVGPWPGYHYIDHTAGELAPEAVSILDSFIKEELAG